MKKRIRFDDISVSNARFNIVQEPDGELYAGGFRVREADAATAPQADKTQAPDEGGWEIGLGDIDLKNVRIHYQSPKTTRQVMIRKAHIDPLQSWNPSSAGNFDIQLAVDQGTIDIQGSAKPYGPTTASAQGHVKISDLPLDWGAPWLRPLEITQVGGTLAADTDFSLALGERVRGSLEGRLSLQQAQGQTPQAIVRPMSLNWDGTLQASLPQRAAPRIAAEGTLAAQRPEVALRAPGLAAEADSIRIQGNFQSPPEASAEPASFVFRGKVDANQLRVDQTQHSMNLARIEHLGTDDLHLQGLDRIQVAAASLRNGRLLERSPETPQPTASEKEYALTFGRLALRDVSLQAGIQHLDSAATKPVPVDLQADLGRYARFQAQGTLQPDPPISINIEGEIKQFSLPEVRGYARDKLGYTIHSGQLYADFQLLARNGQLDSEIKLFLAGLLAKQDIDSQRLMLCAPSLDEAQGAQPTVELAV